MIARSQNAISVRRKIEALGTSVSLPTARRALGLLEGDHPSNRRFGSDDVMDIREYTPSDEARLIDWKTSARVGRPMVVQRERMVSSHTWLLMDVGLPMTADCAQGEQAFEVAANAMCMFASLSLRRSDDVSLVFADAQRITRMPFHGGLAQFESAIDKALERQWQAQRNIEALLEYACRIKDRHALIVIATDEHALKDKHVSTLRKLAQSHPVVCINVATLNPLDPQYHGAITDGTSGRRVPAFLKSKDAKLDVTTHREYAAASWQRELSRYGAFMLRADSSESMFAQFVRMVSRTSMAGALRPSSVPSPVSLGGK
ncbi:MAG: DUF58 domain-containing protein [Bifidobacterium tsurumiense]|uniref:DUF58 domain-containing protein n=1 Tax=Bifidobacterium tsurumiense TaxID=356829 RepID=UPI002A838213|nr:DUF58 domain-containing protein [Bifidobacterium tsurumiense]MDY4677272.1 DUF58 domain-containing protein [Bifidobacterium tsurumiense]